MREHADIDNARSHRWTGYDSQADLIEAVLAWYRDLAQTNAVYVESITSGLNDIDLWYAVANYSATDIETALKLGQGAEFEQPNTFSAN